MPRGRAFLYVLPCFSEDLLKLGISRDPLARMQALHPRYFDFFDLHRALAVETETLRDAQALETRYKRGLVEHNAGCPLTIMDSAGGFTEWFRGAYATLAQALETLRDEGYAVHHPLWPWLRSRLIDAAPLLFDWTNLLGVDERDARGRMLTMTCAQRRVSNVLDAYRHFDIDLVPWLPDDVLAWHRASRGEA